ncbi:PTS glucose transporter subunit IIA [Clostridium niameyense]|uniref:PTS glucose transporter subunit IIA n=1 Tax=Clostridium niameyense TaxID=1622073 RepID=A0A6M0R925_9CLOT|nr:PTS glucose transporter subunit IIA [Clostridium niameyense]NEZ46751.1 PTS glucose transporter subunit IIA [Clostridium niameyense]
MFNFLKKNLELLSPTDGVTFDLSQMPDPVFAQKMSGDGVAIDTTGNTFVAPADGELTFIFNTNHAYALTLDNGIEILVHIGVDTVELEGKGFKRLIEPGKKVKAGTPIIEIDRDFITSKGYCLSTPILITNVEKLKSITPVLNTKTVAGETSVISYKIK